MNADISRPPPRLQTFVFTHLFVIRVLISSIFCVKLLLAIYNKQAINEPSEINLESTKLATPAAFEEDSLVEDAEDACDEACDDEWDDAWDDASEEACEAPEEACEASEEACEASDDACDDACDESCDEADPECDAPDDAGAEVIDDPEPEEEPEDASLEPEVAVAEAEPDPPESGVKESSILEYQGNWVAKLWNWPTSMLCSAIKVVYESSV